MVRGVVLTYAMLSGVLNSLICVGVCLNDMLINPLLRQTQKSWILGSVQLQGGSIPTKCACGCCHVLHQTQCCLSMLWQQQGCGITRLPNHIRFQNTWQLPTTFRFQRKWDSVSTFGAHIACKTFECLLFIWLHGGIKTNVLQLGSAWFHPIMSTNSWVATLVQHSPDMFIVKNINHWKCIAFQLVLQRG